MLIMEDLYKRLDDPAAATVSYSSDDFLRVENFSLGNFTANTTTAGELYNPPCVDSMLQFNSEITAAAGSDNISDDLIKARIANHPRFPNLLSAYIDCQKIGVPSEVAFLLEEICRENNTTRCSSEIGADPELDEFMESYSEVLRRYKEELAKPFDEATTFLSNIELQLSNLCNGEFTRTLDYPSDEAAGTSEEELSYEEAEPLDCQDFLNASSGPADDQDIKGMLMRKYSGYLSSLKKEFLKKKKKGKLPKDAKTTLMDWWNEHYRWPYPTEDDKLKLSKETGLDQKQISNWFINQRKRHWKPSEDMRFALLEGATLGGNYSSNDRGPMFLNTPDFN